MAMELLQATPATPVNEAAKQVTQQQLALNEMMLSVRELDALGKATTYSVGLPMSSTFKSWTLPQQIGMLKAGAWGKYPIAMIAFAIAYADSLGLDIMQGDVYSTGDGRIATSNKAKIKLAMRTGLIVDAPQIVTEETDEPIELDGYEGPQLVCTVSVRVKGWDKPLVKTQKLSSWYVKNNPNWRLRPEHMLELNTLAHTLELISPYAETGEDEIGNLTTPVLTTVDVGVVEKQLAETLAK